MTGWSKYSGERIVVGVDFTPRLETGTSLSPTNPTIEIVGGGTLVATFQGITGNVVAIELAGGIAGSTNALLVTAFDASNRPIAAVEQVTVLAVAVETDVQLITARLTDAKAQRHLVALGEATVELMRNGRRVVRKIATLEELNDYIAVLERELSEATAVAAGRSRRRGVGLAWSN